MVNWLFGCLFEWFVTCLVLFSGYFKINKRMGIRLVLSIDYYFSPAAWLRGCYWSKRHGFDFRHYHWIFLYSGIILRYILTACYMFNVSWSVFCPMISSEQTTLLRWPQARGSLPIVSMFLYVIPGSFNYLTSR